MIKKRKIVDFDKIENFFKEYGGKPYNNGMSKEDLPQNFINEMKKLDKQIAEKLENKNFKHSTTKIACHNPSQESKFKDYIWIRYKKENHDKDVYCIAVLLDLDKQTNLLRIRVSTEINYQEIKNDLSSQEKQKIDECYKKILKHQPPDFEIEEDQYGNKNIVKTILNNKKTSEQIVNEIVLNLAKLEPAYDGIFSSENIEPKQPLIGEPKMPNDKTNFSLNQILYGPPGTGKTYNTIVKAMSIIDDKNYKYNYDTHDYGKDTEGNPITYEKLREKFQEEIQKKSDDLTKRIEFVTFHQSYSYEEFVEGIKPDLENGSKLKYTKKDGIFKEICNRASKTVNKEISFNELWNIFKSTYKEGDKIKGLRSEQVIHYINNGESLQYQTNTQSPPSLPKYKIEEYYKEHKIKPIENTNDLFDVANKLGEGKGENGVQPLLLAVIHALEQIEKNQLTHKEPYVLIIDEINRGNISKIFGELITLIEEDKRAGGDNALTVTLPYSQKPFFVPNNLYIIGTMNTADRSIALLDTALRRRFDFDEMPPDEKLLENKIIKIKDNSINLKNVLTNINKNIVDEKIGGLDKNYKIGHAFFINVDKGTQEEQESKLKRAFLNKIYPLLEEYFYDDENKIAKVLYCEDKEGKNLLENIYEGDNWVKILERLSKQKTQDDEE